MVSTVLQCNREQCSRKKSFRLRERNFGPKLFFLSAALLHCNTVLWSSAQARDLGTHGIIYPIAEDDPIVVIQNKLKKMEVSGELDRHYKALQQKTKETLEYPKPVEGITKTVKARVFYYDPTYVVKEDVTDHIGKVLVFKGTKINPLETVSLSQNLLFFDGDDPDQLAFAKGKLKEGQVKLILVKGAPMVLSEELHVPVYFDQTGILTEKLRIQHVPALVTQEDKRLQIEEIQLQDKTNNESKGNS